MFEREGVVGRLPTQSPDALKEARLHRRTLQLIYGFTQTNPPKKQL